METSNGDISIHLDSAEFCFLCLRENAVRLRNCSNDSYESTTFSFRNLSRYLKVRTGKVLKSTGAEVNFDYGDKDNLTVSLCEECCLVTKRFDELYHTLEVTKLHLTRCVEEIQGFLLEAENDYDRNKRFRRSMLYSGHVKLLRGLRKETISKCEKKLKGLLPRVRVKRLNPVSPFGVVNHSESEVASDDGSVGFEDMEPDGEDSDQFSVGELESSSLPRKVPRLHGKSSNRCLTAKGMTTVNVFKNSSLEKLLLPLSVTTSTSSSSAGLEITLTNENMVETHIFTCPHCSFVTPTSPSSEEIALRQLGKHLIQYHCETNFLDFKDPTITKNQFQIIVSHLLYQNLLEETISMNNLVCNFCDMKILYRGPADVLTLKIHLTEKHHDLLAEKLNCIQKDEELQNKLSEKGAIDYGGNCKFCGIYLRRALLQNHMNKFCHERKNVSGSRIDTLPVTHLDPNAPINNRRCSYCTAELATKYMSKMHLLSHHCGNLLPKLELGSVADIKLRMIYYHLLFQQQDLEMEAVKQNSSGETKKIPLVCPYCHVKFKVPCDGETNPLKLHLVEDHRALTVKKLMGLQQDPHLKEKLIAATDSCDGGTCTNCGLYLSNSVKLCLHENKYCTSAPINNRKKSLTPLHRACEKCGKRVLSRSMAYHKVLYCKGAYPTKDEIIEIPQPTNFEGARKTKNKKVKVIRLPPSAKIKCKLCGEVMSFSETAKHKSRCSGNKNSHPKIVPVSKSSSSSTTENPHSATSTRQPVIITLDDEHTNALREGNYVCKDCGENFISRKDFKAHKTKHLQEQQLDAAGSVIASFSNDEGNEADPLADHGKETDQVKDDAHSNSRKRPLIPDIDVIVVEEEGDCQGDNGEVPVKVQKIC